MIRLKQTEAFRKWHRKLKDQHLRGLVAFRLARLIAGNPGDVKPVGKGISELRIDYGPGYRIYFQSRGSEVIILLCGGDKKSQAKDIEAAENLAEEWSDVDE